MTRLPDQLWRCFRATRLTGCEDLEVTRLADLCRFPIAEDIRDFWTMEERLHRSEIEPVLGLCGGMPPPARRSMSSCQAGAPALPARCRARAPRGM